MCALVIYWLATPPMDPRIKTYLRTLRRRWGLSQRELAFLIGAKDRAVISRIEGLKRTPSLIGTFGFAFLFDTAPSELFPGLFSEVQEGVLRRASDLYEELQGNSSKTTRVKLDFLESVLARSENKHTPTDV